MKIYESEKGLEQALANNKVIVSAYVTKNDNTFKSIDSKRAEAVKLYPEMSDKCKEAELEYLPPDLTRMDAILVTSNWNLNDDVFSPDELYAARYSPLMKPVNMNHMGKEDSPKNTIMGVICRASAVDSEYKPFYAMEEDDVPDKFHILVTCMLWSKYFPEATADVCKRIDENKQFMSMECLFSDFGYALKKDGSDVCNLMPRNEITAYMTKSLRSYGGTGKIKIDGNNYNIGRWLKSYIFSGAGLVEQPANPESIVFEDYLCHSTASQKIDFIKVDCDVKEWKQENLVNLTESSVLNNSKEEETIMSKEQEVKTDVAVEALAKQIAELKASLEDAKNQIAKLTSEKADTQKALEAAEKAKSEFEAKANKAESANKALKRFEQLKNVNAANYLSDKEDAALEILEKMDDASFAAILKVATEANKVVEAGKSNLAQLTEQYKSSAPKLTEQTKTGNTKLTEAEKKDDKAEAEEALASAKKDEDANLAAMAASNKDAKEGSSALDKFVGQTINKNSKKANK